MRRLASKGRIIQKLQYLTLIILYLDHSKESQNGRSRRKGVYDCINTPIDIFSMSSDEADL